MTAKRQHPHPIDARIQRESAWANTKRLYRYKQRRLRFRFFNEKPPLLLIRASPASPPSGPYTKIMTLLLAAAGISLALIILGIIRFSLHPH